jgi:PhoD-like phosphatase
MWVVPGAPLPLGTGWRIWYSQRGPEDFRPSTPTVSRAGTTETVEAAWELLPALDGVDRRMGILTLTLAATHPGSIYELSIPEADPLGVDDARTYRWRSAPDSVDGGVTFQFASCFWRPNDKEGSYRAAVAHLAKIDLPAFKILMGDQVYQDYPVNWILPKSSRDLYAERYESYWGDTAYRGVLTSSPNYFLCDDHEFWNDYPERQIHLPRTWPASGRQEIGGVANDLYHRYQRSANPEAAAYYAFSIGPGAASPAVSFFVSDSRSARTNVSEDPHHFFGQDQWTAFQTWAEGLDGPGVLIIGQPIFQRDGDWKDHSLSNFGDDYGRLCQTLQRILTGGNGRAPHDVLVLTGDIHNGRFGVGTIRGPAPSQVYEFVASPASHIGPYLFAPHVQQAPTRFPAEYQGRRDTWDVRLEAIDVLPTLDNNLGSIRMSPGTNGRVRFELALWRIRPYDSRSFWQRIVGTRQPNAPVTAIFRRELQLR